MSGSRPACPQLSWDPHRSVTDVSLLHGPFNPLGADCQSGLVDEEPAIGGAEDDVGFAVAVEVGDSGGDGRSGAEWKMENGTWKSNGGESALRRRLDPAQPNSDGAARRPYQITRSQSWARRVLSGGGRMGFEDLLEDGGPVVKVSRFFNEANARGIGCRKITAKMDRQVIEKTEWEVSGFVL